MADQNVVLASNLGSEFALGSVETGFITVKLQSSLVKNAAGEIGVDITALDIVSGDAGNVLSVGADGGAFFDQAALQSIETVFNGSAPQGFMSITPAGVNGHEPVYNFDFSDPEFIEASQDAFGLGAAEGLGLTYDDALNSIGSAFANLTFGDGLQKVGDVISAQADASSPSTVTVTAAGISVTPGISADAGNLASLGSDNKVMVDTAGVTALATVEVCDAFGVPLYNAFPL